MEEFEIIYAIKKVEKLHPDKIVRQVGAYIIAADNHEDLYKKANLAFEGENDGFYTIEEALKL
jgi:hypothetical protein